MSSRSVSAAHQTPLLPKDHGHSSNAAIDKAVNLLAAFRDEGSSGVGVSELARRADMYKSTAYRVLEILERNGMVERVGTCYRLGRRLYEIGHGPMNERRDTLRDSLIPFVVDVHQHIGETTHLAVLDGSDVVYLAKLYGYRQVRSPSRVGGRTPAHCTAVGKALLAYERPPKAQKRPVLQRYTSRTITDPTELDMQLARIHRSGIAFDDEEIQPGLRCVAVPVFGPNGIPVAALSISGPTDRIDGRKHTPILRRIASSASTLLVSRAPSSSQHSRR